MVTFIDRVPTYPGRVRLTPVTGQSNVYDLTRADEPTEVGTPLNAALFQAIENTCYNAAAYTLGGTNARTNAIISTVPVTCVISGNNTASYSGYYSMVNIGDYITTEYTLDGFNTGGIVVDIDGVSASTTGQGSDSTFRLTTSCIYDGVEYVLEENHRALNAKLAHNTTGNNLALAKVFPRLDNPAIPTMTIKYTVTATYASAYIRISTGATPSSNMYVFPEGL